MDSNQELQFPVYTIESYSDVVPEGFYLQKTPSFIVHSKNQPLHKTKCEVLRLLKIIETW